MINKKNVWFLTLFSLILVLSVYYITMPSDLLLPEKNIDEELTYKGEVEEIDEASILTALKVDYEEDYENELQTLREVLTSKDSTTDEKNNAFEKMKSLNSIKSEQEELEALIKNDFNYDSFVKIDGEQIRVVISSKTHDTKLANQIMRLIQSKYTNKMYITVKFQ